jgi:hypothetical protein
MTPVPPPTHPFLASRKVLGQEGAGVGIGEGGGSFYPLEARGGASDPNSGAACADSETMRASDACAHACAHTHACEWKSRRVASDVERAGRGAGGRSSRPHAQARPCAPALPPRAAGCGQAGARGALERQGCHGAARRSAARLWAEESAGCAGSSCACLCARGADMHCIIAPASRGAPPGRRPRRAPAAPRGCRARGLRMAAARPTDGS